MLPLAKEETTQSVSQESACQGELLVCMKCYHNHILESWMLFAFFLIEVNEFLKTLSKRQSPKVAKQRQTDHQDLGI